jgi:hypothetical protein
MRMACEGQTQRWPTRRSVTRAHGWTGGDRSDSRGSSRRHCQGSMVKQPPQARFTPQSKEGVGARQPGTEDAAQGVDREALDVLAPLFHDLNDMNDNTMQSKSHFVCALDGSARGMQHGVHGAQHLIKAPVNQRDLRMSGQHNHTHATTLTKRANACSWISSGSSCKVAR